MGKLILSLFFIILLLGLVSAGMFSNFFKVIDDGSELKPTKTSNYERGMAWESTAKSQICKAAAGGCIYSAEQAARKLKWSYGERFFIISGGKATKKFINDQKLYPGTFTKEPDFLEVKYSDGKITHLVIVDAKTSIGAVRKEQNAAFMDFCKKSDIPCIVKYVVPKEGLSKSDANFLCLSTIPLAITGPTGIFLEGLCFLAAS